MSRLDEIEARADRRYRVDGKDALGGPAPYTNYAEMQEDIALLIRAVRQLEGQIRVLPNGSIDPFLSRLDPDVLELLEDRTVTDDDIERNSEFEKGLP